MKESACVVSLSQKEFKIICAIIRISTYKARLNDLLINYNLSVFWVYYSVTIKSLN